jgi:hypothetical protein
MKQWCKKAGSEPTATTPVGEKVAAKPMIGVTMVATLQ